MYIQIVPLKWHIGIGFRFSLLGCANDDELVTQLPVVVPSDSERSTESPHTPFNSTTYSHYGETTQKPLDEQTTKDYNPIVFPTDSVTNKPVDLTNAPTIAPYYTTSSPSSKPINPIEGQSTIDFNPIVFPVDSKPSTTPRPNTPDIPAAFTTSSPRDYPVYVYTTEKDAEIVTRVTQEHKTSTESPVIFPTEAPGLPLHCRTCPGETAAPSKCSCLPGLLWDGYSCVSMENCNCYVEGIR